MSGQRTIPTPTITPEQAEHLNEAGRRIAETAHALGQALTLAYARSLPNIREKITETDLRVTGKP